MARKPNSMYRSVKQQAYTRREYMGGIPNPRITQFVSGNRSAVFPIHFSLCVNETCQIRHTALESARITANRYLERKIGNSEYRLIIRVFPHQVLRENKQATGAGADRVSQGMRASFGKIVGTAARVQKNQVVITVETFERNSAFVHEALRKAASKLPSSCTIGQPG